MKAFRPRNQSIAYPANKKLQISDPELEVWGGL
jgi:hypothetical protein